jgi:hypothetical protein
MLAVLELMVSGRRAQAQSRALELTIDQRTRLLDVAEQTRTMLMHSAGRHLEVQRERFGT